MPARTSYEKDVRPSVCPPVRQSAKRVICDKTENADLSRFFIPYESPFNLVFWQEERLVGWSLLPIILVKLNPLEGNRPFLIDIRS